MFINNDPFSIAKACFKSSYFLTHSSKQRGHLTDLFNNLFLLPFNTKCYLQHSYWSGFHTMFLLPIVIFGLKTMQSPDLEKYLCIQGKYEISTTFFTTCKNQSNFSPIKNYVTQIIITHLPKLLLTATQLRFLKLLGCMNSYGQ